MENLSSVNLATVESQTVAQIGAGLRWVNVYEQLAAHSLTAIGGRYA